jgi:hypothetical protein
MLEWKVIQPSSSEWCSPIVLAKKSDGALRFCCDYRKFNKQLEKDNYPHPNVQDIIDQLAGNKYFSTIDCVSAFWQLSVNPEDRHKTAVRSRNHLPDENAFPSLLLIIAFINSQLINSRERDHSLNSLLTPNKSHYALNLTDHLPH